MVEEWQVATLAEKIPPQALKQGSQVIARVLAAQAKGLKMVSDFGLQGQFSRRVILPQASSIAESPNQSSAEFLSWKNIFMRTF